MKKILSLILSVILLLTTVLSTLTACGDDGSSSGNPSGGGNDSGAIGDGGSDGSEDEPVLPPPCVHKDLDDDLACDECGEPFDDLEDLAAEGLSYKINEDGVSCTVRSLGTAIKNRRYVIPAEIDGYAVTDIAPYAFRHMDQLIEVVIPEGVKSIGEYAFFECRNLRKVIIADSVEFIGESCFEYCPGLVYVKIGDGLRVIGERLFYCCNNLIWVDMGNNVEEIGDYAFNNCASLLSFTLPETLTTVADSAFGDCYKLYEIINKTSGFYVPTGSSTFGKNVLHVSDGETKYVLQDDFVFLCTEDVNYLCGYVGASDSIVLPESFNGGEYEIATRAFRRSNSLVSVAINGVTSITNQAFESCSNLRWVTVGNSVSSVGIGAFADCPNLTVVELGENVGTLEMNAFSNCYKLTEVVDNSSSQVASAVGNSGINQYKAEIHNGESRTKVIGEFVFYVNAAGDRLLVDYLGSARTIVLPEDFEGEGYNIGYRAFYGNTTALTVTFPECVTKIGEEAFYDAKGLVYLNFPNTVTEISAKAFYGCSNLIRVDIGTGVATIADGAFTGCNKITEVNSRATAFTVYVGSSENGGVAKYAKEVNRFWNSTIQLAGDFVFYMPDGNKVPYVMGYVGESDVLSLPEMDPKGSNLIVYYSYAFAYNTDYNAVFINQLPYQLGKMTFFQSFNVTKIFLYGGESAKNELIKRMGIENPQFKACTIFLYSEEQPTEDGFFWHYDEDGNIIYW